MADNRTIEELLQAPTEGYGEAIVIPEINADHFEIKTNWLQLVQENPYHGFQRKNPHTHINNFKRITSTLKFKDVPNDVIKLMLFPYSLEGAARVWYDKEPPNSILTWEDLVNKFVNQFFSPSETTHLKNEISRFTQRFKETLGEAWERFKKMLRACPHHGFTKLTQIDTFYNGLNENDQDSLNAAAGGNLEENASKTDDWINKLADQISTLVDIVSKKVITLATVKAVEESCVRCGGNHAYYNCDATYSNQSSVCAATGIYNKVAPQNRASNYMAPPDFALVQNNGQNRFNQNQGQENNFNRRNNFHGRSFLRTGRALIDVYREEITLRVNDEPVTFNLNQTTRYSSTYDDMSVNQIDIIDVAREEYAQEMLGFSNNSLGGNPTSTSKPIISNSSHSFTPFEGSDFILEEIEAYLKDVLISLEIDHSDCDPKGDICLIEKLLNDDPFQLLPMDLKQREVVKEKSSIEEPPEFELKDLPSHLEYAYLEGADIIIAKGLKENEKEALLKVLKSHKRAIPWKITDIKGIDPRFCTHKILMEEDYKPAVQSQRRVNPKIHEVIKKEKGGITIVENENNELIPTRLVTDEIEAYLKDESISLEIDHADCDSEGDICLIEKLLNDDPFQLLSMDLKQGEVIKAKSLTKEPSKLELKDLPSHLEYAYLEGVDKLPVIIAKDLKVDEKQALLKVLKSHKSVIAWKITNIKGIDPRFCTDKILMEEDYKPAVQSQRRVNPKIHEVIKKEVIKLLDAGMIYPISDSSWVSPIYCVPKKGGITVVENEKNELIPT
nr:reverse transcriptase domain-containing protein [Tanacetum cinerariifolium]